MANVYLVTAGCYSDYRIEAAFSTKQHAEEFAAKYNSDRSDNYETAEVEEYELDAEVGAKIAEVYESQIHLHSGTIEEIGKKTILLRRGDDFYGPVTPHANYAFTVSEDSQAHANKLAAEKRQEWLRLRAAAMIPSIPTG